MFLWDRDAVGLSKVGLRLACDDKDLEGLESIVVVGHIDISCPLELI